VTYKMNQNHKKILKRKKIAIVANAHSGQETAQVHTFQAQSKLWGWEIDIFYPKSIENLQEVSRQVAQKSDHLYEAMVVIGGDGTLNQVVQSFLCQPNSIPIYPFPAGTANDLAHELGLNADWDQVQTCVDQKQYDSIDLVTVNGVPFSTVGGFGIGSLLTKEFNQKRKNSDLFKYCSQLLGEQVYTLLSAKTILLRRDYIHRVRVSAPGFDEVIKTPALFICNQNQLGGNLQVAPSLDNTDSRFNVLIVTSSMRTQLLTAMAQLKRGKIPNKFFVFSASQLSITDLNCRKIAVFGDGEPLLESAQLDIKILPKSLCVYQSKQRFDVNPMVSRARELHMNRGEIKRLNQWKH
jgi:diacylglycerol kinase (ATP)